MINQTISISSKTNATMKTYVLDQGEYDRRGLKHPAVVVCPGGGYSFVSKNEGEPVALFFNRHGYHAFVVDYSVKIENPFPTALQELAKAVSIVRENKENWLISDEIIVIGFSAGGNLALSLGIYSNEKFLTEDLGLNASDIKPDRLILSYPAVTLHPKFEGGELPQVIIDLIEKGLMPDFRGPNIREILLGKENPSAEEMEELNLLNKLHKDLPPTFIWGSYEDTVIPTTDLTDLASELYRLDVPCELHLFGKGPHGMSLCDVTVKHENEVTGLSMNNWTNLCIQWLEQNRKS